MAHHEFLRIYMENIDKEIKEGAQNLIKKLWDLILPTAQADDNSPEGMELNWEKIQDASGYEVTIARDKELKEVFEKKTIKTNSYYLTTNQPGIFFWRVRAINGLGELQEPSEVGKVLLTVSSPKIKNEIMELTVPLTEE